MQLSASVKNAHTKFNDKQISGRTEGIWSLWLFLAAWCQPVKPQLIWTQDGLNALVTFKWQIFAQRCVLWQKLWLALSDRGPITTKN